MKKPTFYSIGKNLDKQFSKFSFRHLGYCVDVHLTPWMSACPKNIYIYQLALLALVCSIVSGWAWYPGIILSDARIQLLQAQGFLPISDWHPPIMAYLWKVEIFLFRTPYALNTTYSVLTCLGLFLFFRLRPCKMSLLLYISIFISPFILGMGGFLFKDIPLGGLSLLIAGLLLTKYSQNSEATHSRNKALVVGSVFLLLVLIASLLRFNAAAILAPLAVAYIFKWKFTPTRLATCAGIFIILLALIPLSNRFIFHTISDHPETSLEIFDLAGTVHFLQPHRKRHIAFKDWETYQISLPKEIPWEGKRWWAVSKRSYWNHASLFEKLSACYYPQDMASFGNYNSNKVHFRHGGGWDKWSNLWIPLLDKPNHKALVCTELGNQLRSNPSFLAKLTLQTMLNHPISYLHHRWKHFSSIYLQHIHTYPGYLGPSVGWKYGGEYRFDDSPVFVHKTFLAKFYRHYSLFRKLPTNYPIIWIIVLLYLFVSTLECNKDQDRLINCFSFSGLMYLLGYFFVGLGMTGWRYIFPSALITVGALLTWYVYGLSLGSKRFRKIALIAVLPFIYFCII